MPNRLNTRITWAIGLVIGVIVGTLFLTRPSVSTSSLSPVSGLMSLRQMAQSSIAYDDAIANQKPTLVEFYADWCTTCQSLAPTLHELQQDYANQVNFVMLDIDDPRWAAQIDQYQVTGVPKIVLLTTNQQVSDTFIGRLPRSVLAEAMEQLLP